MAYVRLACKKKLSTCLCLDEEMRVKKKLNKSHSVPINFMPKQWVSVVYGFMVYGLWVIIVI